jgi:hypothetical protein
MRGNIVVYYHNLAINHVYRTKVSVILTLALNQARAPVYPSLARFHFVQETLEIIMAK